MPDEPPEYCSFSLTDALVSARSDVKPAVANALWPGLKAGAWMTPTLRLPGSEAPGGGEFFVTTPRVAPPDARYRGAERPELMLFAFVGRVQSRIGRGFTAILHKSDHDRLLLMLDRAHRAEYRVALDQAVCERPFYRDTTQPTGWRRNYKDEALTAVAASVLVQLASLAVVEFLRPDLEDALLG